MMLALYFQTWWLLAGLLAAGIPFLLHLLSSVRAREVLFPTLRFLRLSMEKTARRRRIQHWLLLLLRAALLALLALAAAEPISEAVGGWLAGKRYAAVIILDNSLSMAVAGEGGTRLARARKAAEDLLNLDEKPALAALLTTNGGFRSDRLTADRMELRRQLGRVRIGYGRAPIARRVEAAVKMLQAETVPKKAIYLLSDLQKVSFDELIGLDTLVRSKGVHLFVIDTRGREGDNVGISDLQITGRCVVDSVLRFTATLVNSSPGDRTVDVALRVKGSDIVRRTRTTLRATGEEGSTATVSFRHRFDKPGVVSGEVFLAQADDLTLDNTRRFALRIGGRIEALVVRGQTGEEAGWFDPVAILSLTLEPRQDATAPWSVSKKIIDAERLDAENLKAHDIAFFCEVPSFTESQSKAIADFVKGGGTAVFLLGPAVKPDNYNRRFLQEIADEGGLLPGRIRPAIGEVGPDVEAMVVRWVDVEHPFFEGLHENAGEYLTVLVQRYFPVALSVRPGRTLMRLANGDPLMMVKPFGSGRVVLLATTASPRWSNLPIPDIFLPAITRMCLSARRDLWSTATYAVGAQVDIRPKLDAEALKRSLRRPTVTVIPPGQADNDLPAAVEVVDGVATFKDTSRIGEYRWKLSQPLTDHADSGVFVVNPDGEESDLAAVSGETFVAEMRKRGIERVYVGRTLGEANVAAAADAKGRNWWDLLVAVAIVLLVVEAMVANRRRGVDVIPAHLNPRIVGQAL